MTPSGGLRVMLLVVVDLYLLMLLKKYGCFTGDVLLIQSFSKGSLWSTPSSQSLSEEGIFISQDKYVAEILKKFDFSSIKTASTPIETQKPLVKDARAADVTPKLSHLHAVKRIFRRLISWQCKKQTIVATSTTKAEYVAAANCCRQCIIKKQSNLEIQHHFIRDSYEKKLIQVLKIHTDDNVADLLTKAFDVNLKFVDQHNMVASLEKTEENDESHQIVDFLFTCSINYALTAPRNHIGGADAQTRFETASKKSRDPPLSEVNTSRSRKDRTKHPEDLTDFVPPTPHDSPLSRGHTPKSDKGRVETSTDKSLGKDASKQGRNDDKTDELNLTDGADTEVIIKDKGSDKKGGSTADQVSIARPEVSVTSVPVNVSAATPSTPPTTTTIFCDEDLTIAQTLIKLMSEKAKTKVKVYWWKKKLEKVQRRDQGLAQIESDADFAQIIYEEELAKLDRAQKEKQKQEEATIVVLIEEFNEIQARIDADHELAVRMTHKEQEKYTIEERARLLAEYFERRKKQLAAERAAAIKNKPPTRTQVKNRMITYLKHMGKYTHQQLKYKTLEELQKLYQKVQNYEHEKEELRMWLTVVSDKDETVDPEILSTNGGEMMVEAGGVVEMMLRKFDRQDLMDLHKLGMKRFEDNTPEGYNLLLWEGLKVMFEPNAEDEIWSNQQDWNPISWKLYENCGVHTLLMDGTLNCFNMLVEKRYPLIKEMMDKMLNWKLEAEAESTMAFEILKFIKSQIEE
uniref:Retrovirus-related Pol polyprotein from transposon TNT 1-94 n=1 Tax=Tanacetum cinerariifolium TaxID=118510 RepID=A0A6L2K7Q7_TANCI|nr:hypothetical protein [Tanacetum cinerariifolium]